MAVVDFRFMCTVLWYQMCYKLSERLFYDAEMKCCKWVDIMRVWKYCMEDATKPYCKIAFLDVSLLAHKWMSGKDLPL